MMSSDKIRQGLLVQLSRGEIIKIKAEGIIKWEKCPNGVRELARSIISDVNKQQDINHKMIDAIMREAEKS